MARNYMNSNSNFDTQIYFNRDFIIRNLSTWKCNAALGFQVLGRFSVDLMENRAFCFVAQICERRSLVVNY